MGKNEEIALKILEIMHSKINNYYGPNSMVRDYKEILRELESEETM